VYNPNPFHTFEYTSAALPNAPRASYFVRRKDDELTEFLWENVDLASPRVNLLTANQTNTDIQKIPEKLHYAQLYLSEINNRNDINDFLKTINNKLPDSGIFIGCVETLEQRKQRLFGKYPALILIILSFFDFIIHRVLPKLKLTQKLYLALAKNSSRAISFPEILGRLIYCGFGILKTKEIKGLTYIVVKKEKEPLQETMPSGGMILRMKRIGKGGEIINIYKLRTMYTYSEYLQKYMYENYNLKSGGKFNNDFRVTGWGKIFRKYWIDELPMIINLLKGELKLVGLRPLTQHYLSLYNENLAVKRSVINRD
jgi:hypothetical protein